MIFDLTHMHYLLTKIYFKGLKVGTKKEKITYKI